MAARMPSAMEDLPLPGGPYIRTERPEVTAGPSWSIMPSGRIRWPIDASSTSRVIRTFLIDWRLTCSL
jgi:hypothetical protein